MTHASLEDLLSEWANVRASTASVSRLVEQLNQRWQVADEAFLASGHQDSEPMLVKWVCRRLSDEIAKSEGRIPRPVVGLLVRIAHWTWDEAITSAWLSTRPQRANNGDERSFEHDLGEIIEVNADESLGDLLRSVERYGDNLPGHFAHALIRRLVKAGYADEAHRALALAHDASWARMCLERLAEVMTPDELEIGIQQAWALAKQEMSLGEDIRAYRCADWAELIRLSSQENKAARIVVLEKVVSGLPPERCDAWQMHDDLRGLLAEALASIGEIQRAIAWARRAPEAQRAWTIAGLFAWMPAQDAENLALDLLDDPNSSNLEGSYPRLAPVSPTVAARCLERINQLDDLDSRLLYQAQLLPFLSDAQSDAVIGVIRASGERWVENHALTALEERIQLRREPLSGAAAQWVEHELAHASLARLPDIARLTPISHADTLFQSIFALLPEAQREQETERILITLEVWLERAPSSWVDANRARIKELVKHCGAEVFDFRALLSWVDPEDLSEMVLARLQSSRPISTRARSTIDLIYELCSLPEASAPIHDLRESLLTMAAPSRAWHLSTLLSATPWGRLAVLSRDEVGWAFLVEQIALELRALDLSDDDLTTACRVDSVTTLVSWLVDHTPRHPERWINQIDISAREILADGFARLTKAPRWASLLRPFTSGLTSTQVLDQLLRETNTQRLSKALKNVEQLDGAQIQILNDELRDRSIDIRALWSKAKRRWIEREMNQVRDHHPNRLRADALLEVALQHRLKDTAQEILQDMARASTTTIEQKPHIELSWDEIITSLIQVADAQSDPCRRIHLLSFAATHLPSPLLRQKIAAAIHHVIDTNHEAHDEVFGRAAPHLDLDDKARMWAHAFSLSQATRALAFSWRTTGVLTVAASLTGGIARGLTLYAARIELA